MSAPKVIPDWREVPVVPWGTDEANKKWHQERVEDLKGQVQSFLRSEVEVAKNKKRTAKADARPEHNRIANQHFALVVDHALRM